MLKIRLQRVGRVHEPKFRLVLTESANSTKSGRFKEILGSYDPRKTSDKLNALRIKHWIAMGAGLTPSVHNLLVTHNVITEKKIHVSTKSKYVPAPEAAVEETPTPETPAVETVEESTPEKAI